MKKTLIFKVILVCSFCVMLFSIFNIVTWCVDSKKTKEVTEKIEEMTKVSVVKDSKFLSVDFDELSKVNDEVVAWVQVLDTNVNYPIVKHSNNSYYLNHSYDKSWNSSGWPFLDYRNDFETDYNTVIYGHHMRNSTMFGQMEKFKKEDFFEKNKTITLTSKDDIYEYEIFAIGVYDADFGYNTVNFNDEDDFNNFLDKILSKSMYSRNIVNSSDKIITLSTCSYEYDNARTAIFAVRK